MTDAIGGVKKVTLPALLDEEEWQRILGVLYQRQKQVKAKLTPARNIKMKGEFPYPEYEYMLEEMDRLHPLRAEKFISPPTLLKEPMAFITALEVTDLMTGEVRCGVDIHTVPAYDKDSMNMKPMKTVREFLGNAAKASLSEAQRHAWSNFGICSDLYGSVLDEPSLEQQTQMSVLESRVNSLDSNTETATWWEKTLKSWENQNSKSAEAFLKKTEASIHSMKLEQNKQEA